MPSPSGAIRPVVALACASMMACSSGPQAALSRFPIGIYGVDDPRYIERLKADGFDSFHTYEGDPRILAALAKEAKRQGMRMVVYPDRVREEALARTDGWPVDAWYLLDEPDVVKLSSPALQGLSQKTRAWDPKRPQTFVIGQGAPAETFGRIADILMLDWYPVPHLALDSVADQIDLAAKHLPPGKPLWMVVQAFDWRDSSQRDPSKPRLGRFPSHREIRFMSYLSVLHGARGIFFYRLTKPGPSTLFEYPEEYQAVARVARELRALQPVFEGGKPVPLPFGLTPGLEARAWRYRMRDYVLVLNRNKGTPAKMPGELLRKRWRPLFENRRFAKGLLSAKEDGGRLLPYDVMVLEGN